MSRRIAILGSTGSIGTNALEVAAHLGAGYSVTALSAHTQVEKLLQQAAQHRPAAVAITDERACHAAHQRLGELGVRLYQGPAGLEEMVTRPDVDVVLAAIVGAAGLGAVFAAVRAGKTLALANKEAMVVAGSLLVPEARRRKVKIIPVDSEHSAIFQALQCGSTPEVKRVILTASGGPFRSVPLEKMENATLDDALNHPTWRMGNKISIDSATMFNKGLELIEACWLFDLPPEKVEVVIHPESVVHSMVEFVDGSVVAQLSPPDMRTPIQYALTWPQRVPGISRRLDLGKAFSLNFQPPDEARFPALRIARQVARAGGTMGAVLNAANEAAVAAFTSGKIAFGAISRAVEHTISQHGVQPRPTMDDLLAADRWARECVESLLKDHHGGNALSGGTGARCRVVR